MISTIVVIVLLLFVAFLFGDWLRGQWAIAALDREEKEER